MSRDVAPCSEVIYHRMKYFLSPQLDLYKNVFDMIHNPNREKIDVLDYGCGTGVGSVVLKSHNTSVVGIDCDLNAVEFAKDVFGHLIEFYCEDWCVSSNSKRLFDFIVCVEVIEHVQDPVALLRKFKAHVSATGLVIITTLNHNSQYRKNKCHLTGFHVQDLHQLLLSEFSRVSMTDYSLSKSIGYDSTVTPVVGICQI